MGFIDALTGGAGTALAGAGQTALDTVFGLALEGHNDRRQLRQQQALTDMQIAANKNMAEFNYGQQMKMWEATGYEAQRKQMEAAGLNPALMYGMKGGGGQTVAAAQGAGVGGGQAPSGGGEVLGLMMAQAQIENIKANTAKTQAETPGEGQTQGKLSAEIENIKQQTNNARSQQALTEIQTDIAKTEADIKSQSKENTIASINLMMQKLGKEFEILTADTTIKQETLRAAIQQATANLKQTYAETALKQAQTKLAESGVKLNDAEIMNMAKKIQVDWANWENGHINATAAERNAAVNNYINDMPDSWKAASDVISGIIDVVTLKGILGGTPARNPIGFK